MVGGRDVLVGVLEIGILVEVAVNPLDRVRVGRGGVQVIIVLIVGVPEGIKVGEEVGRSVWEGVEIKSEIPTTVIATAVLMGLEKAEFTMSPACRSMADACVVPGAERAAAETMQIRLNPNRPAAKTVNGAEYSRTFTLDSLFLRYLTVKLADCGGSDPLSYKYSTVCADSFAQALWGFPRLTPIL